MRNHVLMVAISAFALTWAPAVEARERVDARSVESLTERRAELVASGATYWRVAALDTRIETARREENATASRRQRLEQSRLDRNLASLLERRAELVASGARYSRVASLDAQIETARKAGGVSTSDVGVRSARTSPPYGHAYGYWAHGPGSRANETADPLYSGRGWDKVNGHVSAKTNSSDRNWNNGNSGNNGNSRNNGNGKGKGKGHSK
jgi:hypothetical protein